MQYNHKLIQRVRLLSELQKRIDELPVTVILGARQTGKTTLARLFSQEKPDLHYFDLERTADRSALATPELTLSSLKGLILIDEVQRMPALFEILRPLTDRTPLLSRFLLLGSASPGLIKGVSESLAGRALFLQVPGFSLDEVSTANWEQLWLRGGFPRSWLAASEAASLRWREAFVTAFLERDIPQLGIHIPAETLRRFWNMLCHYHGQLWNASELARSFGTTEKTARHYLDILAGAFVVRILPSWYENIGKRQIKAPKVYIRDSGLLHMLMGIKTMRDLSSHPKYGASWEGFVLEQILALCGEQSAFFWRTRRGAELDLMLIRHGKRFGFEFKCQDAPSMTRSLHSALSDLGLTKAYVVYPGEKRFPLHGNVEAVPVKDIVTLYNQEMYH